MFKNIVTNIEKVNNPLLKLFCWLIVAIAITNCAIYIINSANEFYQGAKQGYIDGYNNRTEQRSERLEGKINQKMNKGE